MKFGAYLGEPGYAPFVMSKATTALSVNAKFVVAAHKNFSYNTLHKFFETDVKIVVC